MGAHAQLERRARAFRWAEPFVSRARGACNACVAAYDAIVAEPWEAAIHRAAAYATRCRHRVHDALTAVRARR